MVARILAGEANTPGIYAREDCQFPLRISISPKPIYSPSYAGSSWVVSEFLKPLVFDDKAKIYNRTRD